MVEAGFLVSHTTSYRHTHQFILHVSYCIRYLYEKSLAAVRRVGSVDDHSEFQLVEWSVLENNLRAFRKRGNIASSTMPPLGLNMTSCASSFADDVPEDSSTSVTLGNFIGGKQREYIKLTMLLQFGTDIACVM